ncbi:NAD(P)/FAD-dependent oxidoreductase [Geminocystis sp. NIES-3709]|uniref:NAD(P)/FAD-dependent oxidoreductase n=1 Tax=Geminocystis sp. NIES-3709 TaxID=1617448 RepID=UPI0005FC5DBE|nr:NAD(P)/FAD-dependent oxidoreductase [Geminocystis sp. NIES-3709]BAQ64039.1 adrenodoxin reductase [Geminocystis sp. NIES-3709]
MKIISENIIIIGAGPAGLTCAYELIKNNLKPIVVEQANLVGGISRTEIYQGYHFDIGGHRFYTKVTEIEELWHEVLGDNFIKVSRLSRIYYKGKFFDYPLSFKSTLTNLGIIESALILWSYLKTKLIFFEKKKEPETFEDWVIDCFGERLYYTFFKTYTEKVWGIPCNQIQAEWAKQRIKGMSLKEAIINIFFGKSKAKSLINQFNYPILGPGMMWETFTKAIENREGKVQLNSKIIKINRKDRKILSIEVEQKGEINTINGEHFISSMPLTKLLSIIEPKPPKNVLEVANKLNYRDFLIVALIIDAEDLFPDNWIYIHDQNFRVGRIQNFKNWSPKMVPDSTKTCLGMEYFCSEGDDLWNLSNSELIQLATQELKELGLLKYNLVEGGTVLRQKKAYPVYDQNYYQYLTIIKDYLGTFENLQTIGRNGMHRYNNQDHSMLTGLLAAKNILGEKHDLWEVNTERSYYEEFTKIKK